MSETNILIEDEVREYQFEELYQRHIVNGGGEYIPYELDYPKHEFLTYLVKQQGIILHGSPNKEIQELEPRQANCKSKEFGNLKAVYAVKDPILPIFYAIKDVRGVGFVGAVRSGYGTRRDSEGRVTSREYSFSLHPTDLANKPWADGAVYILPKDTFVQGHNDDGKPIDEWASEKPVKPLAKLAVSPDDFPYMDSIKAYDVIGSL